MLFLCEIFSWCCGMCVLYNGCTCEWVRESLHCYVTWSYPRELVYTVAHLLGAHLTLGTGYPVQEDGRSFVLKCKIEWFEKSCNKGERDTHLKVQSITAFRWRLLRFVICHQTLHIKSDVALSKYLSHLNKVGENHIIHMNNYFCATMKRREG